MNNNKYCAVEIIKSIIYLIRAEGKRNAKGSKIR